MQNTELNLAVIDDGIRAIDRENARLQSLSALKGVLTDARTLLAAVESLKAQKANAEEERDRAVSGLNEAQQAVGAAGERAEKIVADANEDAKQIRAAAERSAEETRDSAQRLVESKLANAQRESDAIVRKAQEAKQAAEQGAAAAKAQRERDEKAATEARADLEALTSRLDAARAEAKRIMGA